MKFKKKKKKKQNFNWQKIIEYYTSFKNVKINAELLSSTIYIHWSLLYMYVQLNNSSLGESKKKD